MAYRFKNGDKISKAFQRIAEEQLLRSQALLGSAAAEGTETAIHETRKALKRTRALLRIVRGSIAHDDFALENERLRDIARLLSGARDRHVLADTLAQIATGSAADTVLQAALGAARGKLAAVSGAETTRADIDAALGRLGEAREALAKIDVPGHGFAVLAGGLKRTYRQGRKALGPGAETGSDEEWHEARKAVQAHWRHMALLARLWPDAMLARVRLARRLSELLGQDHDLALLSAFAGKHLQRAHADAIDTAVRRRQKLLREEAVSLGAMLFAEKPNAFIKRIAGYWDAAASLSRDDSDVLDVRQSHESATSVEQTAADKPSGEPLRLRRTNRGKAA